MKYQAFFISQNNNKIRKCLPQILGNTIRVKLTHVAKLF